MRLCPAGGSGRVVVEQYCPAKIFCNISFIDKVSPDLLVHPSSKEDHVPLGWHVIVLVLSPSGNFHSKSHV